MAPARLGKLGVVCKWHNAVASDQCSDHIMLENTPEGTTWPTHPSHSLGQQSLATAGGAVEEEAPWRDHTKLLVHLWVPHVDEQLTHLLQGSTHTREPRETLLDRLPRMLTVGLNLCVVPCGWWVERMGI